MKNSNDPLHVTLETAVAEYQEINRRLAPLLAEEASKKAALLAALGEVIIQFVATHGQFHERTSGKKRIRRIDKKWCRGMGCSRVASDDGFENLINAAFGQINWEDFYRPALEMLDPAKATFLFGMGDCAVVLCEELTTEEMEAMMRARHENTT